MKMTRRLGCLARSGLPITFCLSLLSLLETAPVAADTPSNFNRRQISEPIYGITLENLKKPDEIKTALESFSRRMTVRVVFQWPDRPDSRVDDATKATYVDVVSKINPVAYVMGEILDADALQSNGRHISVQQYHNRTSMFLDALGDLVDIWEIANEINSSDIYKHYKLEEIKGMLEGAYRIVKDRGARAAITLYLCRSAEEEYQMIRWARANISEEMKRGLDYVLVSYYENDRTCRYKKPNWDNIFRQLSEIFPNARVGFGEIGTEDGNKKHIDEFAERLIKKYYTLRVNAPRYVGGYFWWGGRRNFVPCSKRLWKVLDDAIRGGNAPGRCRAAGRR